MNPEKIQGEFPVVENQIFFDHAKVSPLPMRVREAVNAFVEDASSFGTANYTDWMAKVESARASFARLIPTSGFYSPPRNAGRKCLLRRRADVRPLTGEEMPASQKG